MSFRADMRAAAIELLQDYASSASVKLNTYRGRPRSILPPHAFVENIRETLTTTGTGSGLQQRRPQVDVILVHGIWDGGEATDQADAFVDGFVNYVKDQYHAAGPNTLTEIVNVEDIPTYVPDWMAPELQRSYFATLITLEGYAENPEYTPPS